MTTKTKWIHGNQIFYDGNYGVRWLDAFGTGVCKVIEDWAYMPFASANNPAAWTTTNDGSSTVALTAGAEGGTLLITTHSHDTDGINMQVQGEAFKMTSDKPCYFGCKVQISEVTESGLLVGLCITDDSVLAAVSDGVYFRKPDSSTTCSFVLEKSNAETTGTAQVMVANTDYTFEFYWDGEYVDFWVDGVLQTRLAQTNLTAEYLTPTISFLTGEDVSHTCSVSWITAIQLNTA